MADERSIKLDILQALMTPLIRFCVKHSHSIHDVVNVAKLLFVKVAEEEIRKTTTKVNVSRISVMTGLYRDEVTKYYKEKFTLPEAPESVFARVIGHWRQNSRFTTKNGDPRVLTCKGENSEFQDLVECITKNINHGTVLFELKRQQYVEETPKGVKLLRNAFTFQSDPRQGFQLLGSDLQTMMWAVEENLLEKPKITNLHIRTEYDNVVVSELDKIRRWFADNGKAFHRKARKFVSKYDKDINPKLKGQEGGAKVSITAFSFTALPPAPAPEKQDDTE